MVTAKDLPSKFQLKIGSFSPWTVERVDAKTFYWDDGNRPSYKTVEETLGFVLRHGFHDAFRVHCPECGNPFLLITDDYLCENCRGT